MCLQVFISNQSHPQDSLELNTRLPDNIGNNLHYNNSHGYNNIIKPLVTLERCYLPSLSDWRLKIKSHTETSFTVFCMARITHGNLV